jgi:glycosyl-4,4'-diaponeurosporenoate acyltransferase
MLFELPILWTVVLNISALAGIQLGCAWLFTRMPRPWFERSLPPPKRQSTKTASIAKAWKRFLPDGAAWFAGGFAKRSLQSSDVAYLRRFISETRRGEACHWTAMVLCALPFLWNPWWGCLIITVWAVGSNVPCIVLQRVNRGRLARVIHRRQAIKAAAKSARS